MDHLEINEPEDLHERDELGKGKKCREIHYLSIALCQKQSISELHSCFNEPPKGKSLLRNTIFIVTTALIAYEIRP